MPPEDELLRKVFDEVVASRADICVLDEKLDNITEIVKKHERVLYRSNGKPGLLDRIDDLEEESEARSKKRRDDKKIQKGFAYTMAGAVCLLVIDIVLSYFGVI